MKNVLLCFVFLLVTGCAAINPAKRMESREEWLKNTSHFFPDKTVDEVLIASEKVFRLSDPSDVYISHSRNKMTASRRWMVYAVFTTTSGRWNFEVFANEQPKGTKAEIRITSNSSMISPMLTYTPTPNSSGIGTTTDSSFYISGSYPMPQVYDLFWKRVEAILYNKKWIPCKEYILNPIYGNHGGSPITPICQFADDIIPENANLSKFYKDWVAERKRLKILAEKKERERERERRGTK